MYDYVTGSFTNNVKDNWIEHFETTYYIKYNIEKALYSLNKILDKKPNIKEFSNRCTYYHFYVDSLIDSVGNIRNRFSFNNRENINKDRVIRNIKEYNFGELDSNNNFISINYNSLNKKVRDFVQHIDEKDEMLMKEKNFFGTFNVIYRGMNPIIKKGLLNPLKKQNNLLNLIDKTYIVYNPYTSKSGKVKYKEIIINLMELKKDILTMKSINDSIYSYLNEKLFD